MPSFDQIRPRLARSVAQGVADQAGGVAYGGAVEGDVSMIAFGGPTADFILYDVVNGAFSQGPADLGSFIDPQINPLPYWYGPVMVQGGGWNAQLIADSTTASGYALNATIDGLTNDEFYFELVVPVNASYVRAVGNAVRAVIRGLSGAGATTSGKVALQYLDVSGNAVGSATSATASAIANGTIVTAFGHSTTSASPLATSASLRIRVGAVLTSDGVARVEITDVRNDVAKARVLIGEDGSPTSFAAGQIYQQNGQMQIAPSGTSVISASATGIAISGSTNMDSTVRLRNIIRATISANQNNYAPTGLATCSTLVLTVSGATRTITGFDGTNFGEGQIFTVVNDNANSVVFAHNSGSSSAGNRILGVGAADQTIRVNGSATFQYFPTDYPNTPFRIIAVNA